MGGSPLLPQDEKDSEFRRERAPGGFRNSEWGKARQLTTGHTGPVPNSSRLGLLSVSTVLMVSWISSATLPCRAVEPAALRGFYFNPWVNDEVRGNAWLKRYHLHRKDVDQELERRSHPSHQAEYVGLMDARLDTRVAWDAQEMVHWQMIG
jgi:hypothetical protein